MRYADRVKELVVKDAPDVLPEEDVEQIMQEEGAMGNNKNEQMPENDWELLRSFSEHDMSDELLVQHAAISDLQQSEDMVVEQHRAVNDFLTQFLLESNRLYNLTNYVDYDQDAYCKEREALFKELTDMATACRDVISDFRAKLAKEEMLSCNVKPTGKH